MVSTVGSTTALKLLDKIIDDLYDFVKQKAEFNLDKNKIKKKLPTLISYINNIRLVKTLWQFDTAVDIESFYCDSHVITPKMKTRKSRRKTINTMADFNYSGNIIIKGIAGQGKSMFLRHLCIKEFEIGNRIPILIELRRINKGESLISYIHKYLDQLEIPTGPDIFKYLLQSGKFVFFFDAFDETKEDMKSSVLNELEYMSSYPNASQIVITSRPNTTIEMSPNFNIYTLDNLEGDEYKSVIRKLANSRLYAKTIIAAISSSTKDVLQLLCNPLLITLLIISYKSYQQIPEKLSDFYESIFLVLLRRHDGTKPGFVRNRECKINDNEYRKVFDTVCFESKRFDTQSYDYKTIYQIIENSMNKISVNEDPDKFLKDIVEVTCLLLKEGGEYRFIHKSVQEYYTASFIQDRPDSLAIRFYASCLDNYDISTNWQQELEFLSEMDQYRYTKYYLLPLCRKWLGIEDDDLLRKNRPVVDIDSAKRIVGGCVLSLNDSGPRHVLAYHCNALGQLLIEHNYLDIMDLDHTDMYNQLISNNIQINYELFSLNFFYRNRKPDEFLPDRDYSAKSITVTQIIEEGYHIPEIMSLAQRIINDIYEIWEQGYQILQREESFDILSEMGL